MVVMVGVGVVALLMGFVLPRFKAVLEPVLIVFLAVLVGSIVIAVALPLVALLSEDFLSPNGRADDE